MPSVEVILYREVDGMTPIVDWFESIRPTAVARCLARLKRLEEFGHELRRPDADFLRDGICELRVKDERMQYRMLYFFHGRTAVVVSHGFIKKESKVPEVEIERALTRKRRFEAEPQVHSFKPRG